MTVIGIEQIKGLFKGRIPGQLVIQFTDYCNADCPQCGMRKGNGFRRSRLTGDEVKRLIDAAAARGIKVLSFTGGEPLLFLDELTEYINYAGRAGIEYIRTGTNGFVFSAPGTNGFESRVKKIAEKLAATPLRNFWISIDSADPDKHEQMRGFPGVVSGLEKALPIFHSLGLYPSANLGINRNVGGEATSEVKREDYDSEEAYLQAFQAGFKSAFADFYKMVIGLGFTMVNTCYPMSVDQEVDRGGNLQAVYAATSTDSVVKFNQAEKAVLFETLLETIPEFRSRVRIFSPRTSLLALCRQYGQNGDAAPHPCRGGQDFFYVSSENGETYPCGYRGDESLGKFWDFGKQPPECQDGCTQCDWECFRDPSELFGPLLSLLSHPLNQVRKLRADRTYFRYWVDDLMYYRACEFFNGRRPPNIEKMKKFQPQDICPTDICPNT